MTDDFKGIQLYVATLWRYPETNVSLFWYSYIMQLTTFKQFISESCQK